MSVIKIFLFALLTACQTKNIRQIKIPEGTCEFSEIELKFEPVKNLSSALRNQELSSIYFYEQKEKTKISINCFKEIIKTINE